MTPVAVTNAPFTSRSLADLHPALRERFGRLSTLWAARFRFRKLVVTCTYRNPLAQTLLWRQGRTAPGARVTECDGVVRLSRHNVYPSEAVDVAVQLWTAEPTVIKPSVTWNAAFYRPLLDFAREVGLVSGGTFRNARGEPMADWPHLELPREVA